MEEAMRAAHAGSKTSIECRALLIQLFIRHNRLVEAEKELKLMSASDDDHVLTAIMSARLALALGIPQRAAEAANQIEVGPLLLLLRK